MMNANSDSETTRTDLSSGRPLTFHFVARQNDVCVLCNEQKALVSSATSLDRFFGLLALKSAKKNYFVSLNIQSKYLVGLNYF